MTLRSPIMLQRAISYLAVGTWITIAILSVLPGNLRPHTGFSGDWEHVAAYTGAAALTVVAFQRLPVGLIIAAFSAASAVFEATQLFIPGRSTLLSNWVASTFGAAAGVLIAKLILNATFRLRVAPARR
ncbi:VanZ family protein [Xanthobacter aminoxidans]|uniref:VanZ family protein n=1 Tax=Xanthobacter aminoxidans TaxID=186280 RepID=UPI003728203B